MVPQLIIHENLYCILVFFLKKKILGIINKTAKKKEINNKKSLPNTFGG